MFIRSLLLAVLATAVLVSSGFTQSPSTIQRTQESIVRVSWTGKDANGEITGQYCTGFSVGIMWVLTAEHCIPEGNEDIFINGQLSRVIKKSDTLALLEAPSLKYPRLEMRKSRVPTGELTTTFGYAYGGPDILILRRYAAGYMATSFAPSQHLLLDNPIASGMSGGPIVDNDGKVLGINQASTQEVSIACPSEEILKFLGEK